MGARNNWYIIERRKGILGNGVAAGDNGGTATKEDFGPSFIEPRDIPENALLDEDGNPILDENGDFILTETP